MTNQVATAAASFYVHNKAASVSYGPFESADAGLEFVNDIDSDFGPMTKTANGYDGAVYAINTSEPRITG